MIELTKAQMDRAVKALGYGKGIVAEKGAIQKTNGGWLRLYLYDARGLGRRFFVDHYLARHGESDLAKAAYILKGGKLNG